MGGKVKVGAGWRQFYLDEKTWQGSLDGVKLKLLVKKFQTNEINLNTNQFA
jgi:hypothetical protein